MGLHFFLSHLGKERFRICWRLSNNFSCNIRSRFFGNYFFMGNCWCSWSKLFGGLHLSKVCTWVLIAFILNIWVALHIVVDVKNMGKLNTIVYFNFLEGEIIKVKSTKNYVQQFRHFQKTYAPFSLDLFVTCLALIKIVLIQNFRLHITLKSKLHALIVYLFMRIFNSKYQILKTLFLLWLVLALLTVSIMDHFTLV